MSYLNWLRTKPCIVCGANAEPHHWRRADKSGVGMKPSDLYAIPLCFNHHRGKDGIESMGRVTWVKKYLDYLIVRGRPLNDWIEKTYLIPLWHEYIERKDNE